MTFETLEIIHGLLKKQFELCEMNAQAEKSKLDQAYRNLEKAKDDPGFGPGAVEEATLTVETCKVAKYEVMKEADKIRRALNEFESHEWR